MVKSLQNILAIVRDFLAPDEERISRLLKLDSVELKRRLPRPRAVEESNVEALFDYRDNNVRALIKAVKYRGNTLVVSRIAEYLYEHILEIASDLSLFEAGRHIFVVPMPISSARRRERGWSQCEMLCREIEKMRPDSISIKYNVLKKISDTRRQTDLKREERLNNVKGSMEAVGDINNSFVFVIDDVYTTGATFREARRALRAAGARKVMGIFIAH